MVDLGAIVLVFGLFLIYLFHTGKLKEFLGNIGIKMPEFKNPLNNIGNIFTKGIPSLLGL
jgi:Sec-independent protein translocase protein TatA